MSAQPIRKLGIIAGGGEIPMLLIQACKDQNIEPFVIGVSGYVSSDIEIIGRYPVGQAKKIMAAFRRAGVRDLVLIGKVDRPTLWTLKPDLTAILFFIQIGFQALMGDDTYLGLVRKAIERKGFTIHGAHEFMQDHLSPKGTISASQPDEKQKKDINTGVNAALALGREDKGQAVIVRDGDVIAQESKDGTDAMIKRAKGAGILVKMCKPQQDMALDLPTIGLQTIQNCIDVGLTGIVVEAGRSFLLNRSEAVALADAHGFFIYGVNADEYTA